jgi:hypothetical protein
MIRHGARPARGSHRRGEYEPTSPSTAAECGDETNQRTRGDDSGGSVQPADPACGPAAIHQSEPESEYQELERCVPAIKSQGMGRAGDDARCDSRPGAVGQNGGQAACYARVPAKS